MAKVVFHTKPDLEAIELQRMLKFKQLSFEERFNQICYLIYMSNQIFKTQKQPQGKGLVIRKPNGYLQ